MSCLLLNENLQHAIVDYLENKAETQIKSNDQDPKARYSPATLINDWYEVRQQSTIPSKSDTPFESEYVDNYRELCKYFLPDRKEYFRMIFDGQGLGQELLMDHQGFTYYNNFATTYDLCFNHLKKNLCGPFPRKYRNGRYLPETDLSLIYGNLTKWGMTEKVIPKPEPICNPKTMEAEYTTEYTPYDRGEVKKLNDFPPRGRKKTDLMAAISK